MELLHNGFTLELCPGAFPLSTDSVALADFVKLPKNAQVLDLGAGCGTLGLMLCAKDGSCHVTGIELDSNAHKMALQNARHNRITDRLISICTDINNISSDIKPGTFTCCISNPPYFSGGPTSKQTPTARRDDLCSMDALMKAVSWALQYGSDLFMVHRPERLAELFIYAGKYQLEPKKLRLLRHKETSPIALVLVQCRKGGKPGLIWEEEYLYKQDGTPSNYYNRIYHI